MYQRLRANCRWLTEFIDTTLRVEVNKDLKLCALKAALSTLFILLGVFFYK